MPTDSATGFVETIRQVQLLEATQLQELPIIQSRFPDPHALAKELIRRGWLTPYQANQVLQGLGRKLNLGPYLLLERLGEGGMGEVYKARHSRMNRIVALKVIRKERLNSATVVSRFQREVRAVARLDHPNIVHAFDADLIGETFILVMELVEGTDLNKLVKQQGRLPIELVCDYVRQAALGLQYIHENGLVHRDIKPSNVLVTNKGVVKILDLGLARSDNLTEESSSTLTETGALLGTPDFIAPEQAKHSKQVDIRADLYSLGCTLYFLLVGQVPFAGDTLGEKLLKQMMDEPMPLEKLRTDVPAGLAGVVRKLMAKRPEDRYQTPKELAEVLQVGLKTGQWPKPVPIRPIQQPGQTPMKWRRTMWIGIGLFLAFLIYLAFQLADSYSGTGDVVIKDRSFETPSVGTEFKYSPTGSPWTFSLQSGLSGNGSLFTNANPNAPEGTQVAFLQGTGGTISQPVRFGAGTYTVQFLAAQRGNINNNVQTFRVLVASNVVGTFTPNSNSYAVYKTDQFTVSGGVHTLTFEGLNPKDGDNTVFIDMVNVQRHFPVRP